MLDKQKMFEVYLQEYDKLKDEQTWRIGFRDNLLYVTLGVIGAIISFTVSNQTVMPSNQDRYYALLVIPWACLILGWAYLVNDEKISAIGKYIRETLIKKIEEQIGYTEEKPTGCTEKLTSNTNNKSILGWEIAHRDDRHRIRRKIGQLIIDQITFVCSGLVTLLAFRFLVPQPPLAVNILGVIEFVLLLVLGWEIFTYADLARGQANSEL